MTTFTESTIEQAAIDWLKELGYAYAFAGRLAEGLSLAVQALGRLKAIGSKAFETLAQVRLAEVFLLVGQSEEAATHGKRALTEARERGERGYEAWALRLQGEIASRLDARVAENRYSQALALATELGMRPLVAHCHAGLARVYRRTGQHDQAQEHLTTATTLYREMGMTYWLEKAEAEMGALP